MAGSSPGPLAGVKVVDASAVIAGPMATQILGDQGADVIKVEAPGPGDVGRYVGPMRGGMSAMFATVNRSKRAIALDLKHPKGREAFLHLIARADVFVENFRPDSVTRLGLDYETLKGLNPRLVYVSMSGFGREGPYAKRRVYDPVIQAVSGFADSQADPKTGVPRLIQSIVCDKLTALTAAQAIVAALFARERTGEGQLVSLNMLDATIAFQWPDAMYNHTFEGEGWQPLPDFSTFYDILPTKDGHVTVITITDGEFRELAHALGMPELTADERFNSLYARMENAEALKAAVAARLKDFTTQDLMARLVADDVPCAPAISRAQVVNDPQVVFNGAIVEHDHPAAGKMRQPRPAAQFEKTPAEIRVPAPLIGQHTDEVLREIGYADADIAALRAAGAAG